MKKIEQKIVNWIRKKVKESNTKGLVVGVSGGIDSAVVSVLAAKAVGKDNVMCVIIPCESQKQDLVDAMRLVTKFKLVNSVIDLTYIYKLLNEMIFFQPTKMDNGNLKARLRMTILYYIANNYNYLVCGTGNKSEIAIGYFTKYGDGASDIEPIGDLYKTDVRKLAEYLGIPQRIIDKAPSAGLWCGQTDENEIGMSYEQLDSILTPYNLYGFGKSNNKKINKVLKLIKNSEHKRSLPPIC